MKRPATRDEWACVAVDAHAMTREACISILAWNDPNGVYTDAASIREGYDILSTEAARAWLESVARSNSLN